MNVHDEFTRRVAADRLCRELARAIAENDTAALERLGMRGFGQYAGRLSELMTDSVRRELLGADDFGAIMDEVAKPAHYAHHLVNEGGSAIQQALDKRQGIRLRVIEPEFNDGRLKGIVGQIAESDSENAADNLATQLGTMVKDMGNEFMRQNAEQRNRAGFKVTITRTGGAKCCPWCADRTGKWELANAPDGVFGCHDNCKCMVDYTNSKGTVRGRAVTHKIDGKTVTKWEFADKIPYTPPRVLTREEAAARGGFAQPRRLTGGVLSDIIGDAILKEVPITDEAIDKVPKIYFNGISDEQAERLVALHKQLLQEAQKYAVGTECSITCDLDFQLIALTVGREGEGNVDIPSPGEFYYFGLHNHPSCETFGLTDLKLFTDDDFMLALTDIGNNSHLRVIYKTSEFDSTEFANYFSDCCSKKIYKGKTVLEINRDYVNSLDQHEKERVLQIVINHLENTLKGGAKYGLSYTEKSPSY